jgi:hypothetical protein
VIPQKFVLIVGNLVGDNDIGTVDGNVVDDAVNCCGTEPSTTVATDGYNVVGKLVI